MKKVRLVVGILVILGLIVGSTGLVKAERSYCLVYIVEEGDCLWSIVENTFTKDIAYWVKITAKENRIEPPYLIYSGQEILIPLPPVTEVLEEEKAVSQAGKLIAGAIKFLAEEVEKLKTEFGGIKNIESEQIKAFDRIEASVNQIRTQGWISVVGVVVIIALIVILLLLWRYHIAKLKEIEKKES